ncbi:hypothetical protein [Roseimicrobium sp. ORNL1]|uniref:hypothetical protein n=1 Tax=Roseimicrobium sp. ORNL1 TaxID=2711231 RepID=UPI0013E14E7C|nr:hypothetical protein [Roseimicrobium sp. ORNL1]QIF01799.1 hypothetical protein G5S37_09760 [Roseimicrobium sp. ORNL1]
MLTLLLASVMLAWNPVVWAFDPVRVPDIDLTLMPGTYTRTVGKVQHVLTFHADKTFQGKSFLNGRLDDEYEGRWQAQKDILGNGRMNFTYTKSTKIPPGTADGDDILVLNKTALTLAPEDANQGRRIWWRVEPKK